MSRRSSSEARALATRARITLFQLVRHAGFPGTVLAFDEAEQGLAVNKTRMASIFSQLMQELNALVNARNGSALVVFALTPDVSEKIANLLPALEQRLRDPASDEGFFDGNTRAPIIDLTRRGDPVGELRAIGERLVEVFAERFDREDGNDIRALLGMVPGWAQEVATANPGASARRELVRLVATKILAAQERAVPARPADPEV
jgi:hypothetical protein